MKKPDFENLKKIQLSNILIHSTEPMNQGPHDERTPSPVIIDIKSPLPSTNKQDGRISRLRSGIPAAIIAATLSTTPIAGMVMERSGKPHDKERTPKSLSNVEIKNSGHLGQQVGAPSSEYDVADSGIADAFSDTALDATVDSQATDRSKCLGSLPGNYQENKEYICDPISSDNESVFYKGVPVIESSGKQRDCFLGLVFDPNNTDYKKPDVRVKLSGKIAASNKNKAKIQLKEGVACINFLTNTPERTNEVFIEGKAAATIHTDGTVLVSIIETKLEDGTISRQFKIESLKGTAKVTQLSRQIDVDEEESYTISLDTMDTPISSHDGSIGCYIATDKPTIFNKTNHGGIIVGAGALIMLLKLRRKDPKKDASLLARLAKLLK